MIPIITEYWTGFYDESDRSLAVSGAAIIDDQVGQLLGKYFVEKPKVVNSLLSPTGALGALGVRNQLSLALGLIDEPTYKDIKLIQKIRNEFAHSPSKIDFLDSRILGLVMSLELPQYVGDPSDPDPGSPKGIFFAGVRAILWNLSTESLRIEKNGGASAPEPIYPIGDREGIEFE